MKRKIAIRATVGAMLCGLLLNGCAGTTDSEDVCAVMFDSRGGTSVETQYVIKGNKIVEPSVPRKECECEFDGWYVGDEKWSFIGYVVTEDMTLTAKWIDCFGLNSKEREILEKFVDKRGYGWRDIASIECFDYVDENYIRYDVIFEDGKTHSIDVWKEYVEEE